MTAAAAPAGLAWREVRALLRRQRRPLTLGLGLVLLNRVAALGLPASSKFVLDDVIGRQRLDMLAPIAALAAGAVVVEAATAFGLTQVVGVAGQRAVAELRQELQAHVLKLPVTFFDGEQTGRLVARIMADAEQVRTLIGTGLVQLVSGLLTAALAFGVLLSLNAKLTGVVVVLLAAYVIGTSKAFGWFHTAYREVSQRNAALTGRLAEALGGIRVVKTYAAERREALHFARESHRLLRAMARALTGVSGLTAGTALMTGATSVVLLLLGTRAVAAGAMTLGDLALFVFLTGLLTMPMLQIVAVGSEASRAVAALGRIGELRGVRTEADEDLGKAPARSIGGRVEFENVSYAYVPGKYVLRNVSFVAEPGTTTAIVGASGAGKSTIVRLLLGFDRPTEGRVLIDGRDLATLNRRDYRRLIGVVAQEAFLFDGTIADNVRYRMPRAPMEAVWEVGRLANCEEFVRLLPQAYDAVVGERGVLLSGGQRQRVAIARALLADPRILILDEATTGLDGESESLVRAATRELMRGRTTLAIGHRWTATPTLDQVLVVAGGTVTEGSVPELAVGQRTSVPGVSDRGSIRPAHLV